MKSTVTLVTFIPVIFSIDLIVAPRNFRKSAVLPTPMPEENENPLQEPTPYQLQFKYNGHSVSSMTSIWENLETAHDRVYRHHLDNTTYGEDLDLASNHLRLVKNHYGALIYLRDYHPNLTNLWNKIKMRDVSWMLRPTKEIRWEIDGQKVEYRRDERMMKKLAEVKELNKSVRELVKKDLKWRKKYFPV